jgi:hypothetical protein
MATEATFSVNGRRTAMDHTTGIRVSMAFNVPHGSREHWLNTWTALGRLALDSFECREFALRSGDTESAVESEWASLQEFNRFARTSGLLWLERASVHTGFIPDSVHREPAQAGQREPVAAGS